MSTRWVIVKVDIDDDVAQGDEYELVVEHIAETFDGDSILTLPRFGLDGVTVRVDAVAEITRLPEGRITYDG